ncbi:MAG: hypothetical protein PUE33_06725 [bacterium]|nr:hypothetical protein [bacterium]
MTLQDEFKYLVGGYYGIMEMDEYDLKVYVLKDIENYIRDFLSENLIYNFDYKKEAEYIKDTMLLRTKLQDSLLVLYKINASMDLVFMVKRRLKELDLNKNNS